MPSHLPSSFGLLSHTFRAIRAERASYLKALIIAAVLLSVLLIAYGSYAMRVVAFSEGGMPVPELFVGFTFAFFGALVLIVLGFSGFVLLEAADAKQRVKKVLRSLPRAMVVALLWWLCTFLLPGFVSGFFAAPATAEDPGYLPSVLSIVLSIVAFSFTVHMPHLAIVKKEGIFTAFYASVRASWPVVHLLLLRVTVAWMFSVVALLLAVIIGAAISFFLPPVAAMIAGIVWSALAFAALLLYWLVFAMVLSGASVR